MTPSNSGFQVRTPRAESEPPDTSTDAERSSSAPRTQRTGRVKHEGGKVEAVSDLLHGRKPREEANKPERPATDNRTQPRSSDLLTALGEGDEHEAEEGGASDRSLQVDAHDDLDLSDIKALAAKLGTTPKKLYETLKFQVGESQLTLGQLKDAATERTTAVQETVKREAALVSREAGIVRDEQMLSAVIGDLQGKLQPETVRQLQARTAQREEHERNMVRRTMPELQDPQTFSTFRNELAEMMSEYGFQPQELVIGDHRILLAMRDMLRFKRIIAKVANLETDRSRKDPPSTLKSHRKSKPSKQAAKQEVMQRARRGSEADKLAAVSSLIRGN